MVQYSPGGHLMYKPFPYQYNCISNGTRSARALPKRTTVGSSKEVSTDELFRRFSGDKSSDE